MLGALGGALELAKEAGIILLLWFCACLLVGPLAVKLLRRSRPRPPRRRPLLIQVDPGELYRALSEDDGTSPLPLDVTTPIPRHEAGPEGRHE